MPFNIQNLTDRARQAGQRAEDYVSDIESSINNKIRETTNIFTNGIESAVEGAVSDIQGAIDDLFSPLDNLFGGSRGSGGIGIGGINGFSSGAKGIGYTGGPLENKLSKFASYNYVFTFGPLTNTEINYPDNTYRANGPSIVILKSGGTQDSQVRTYYEKELGITTEYFIDNVQIDSIIAPTPQTKQTNATNLNFTVTEPYSMGLFLQTLQLAALQAGHKNYIEAPYLLTVEFFGWDDNGRPVSIPQSKRMFPMKLTNTTFNVTEGGSVYTVDAIPWHEQAFSDEVQRLDEDINIKGENLLDFLQTGPESLATLLNSRQLELEQSDNRSADQYVIMFPNERSSSNSSMLGELIEEAGATTAGEVREITDERRTEIFETLSGIQGGQIPDDFDAELSSILGIVVRRSAIGESIRDYAESTNNTNGIGVSSIVRSYLDSGEQYFGRPAFVEDENNPGVFNRGNITISDNGRRVSFKQGTRIQEVIEEMVLLSEYGRQFVTQPVDENGNKDWFRIEADVYNVTDSPNVDRTGRSPRVFVYKVVPYTVNSSRINSPTAPTPNISNLQRQALKQYDYIYTGANDDIINFDIQVDAAFFTAIQSDYGQLSLDSQTSGSSSLADPGADNQPGQNPGNNANRSVSGTAGTETSTGPNSGANAGGVRNYPENQIARAFNDAIVNSPVDLITADIEIWGDPYYIADSGMGNYSAAEVAQAMNLTSDGTMDYQSGEVDILINFKTPVDIGENGYMSFPGLGTKPVGAFSGLYQVIYVFNKFVGGKFTQEMKTVRRRNQEIDSTADPVTQNNETVVTDGNAIANTQNTSAGQFTGDQEDTEAGSQGGTGGQSSQGSGSQSAGTESPPPVQGGRGRVVEQPGERARYAEEQRINRVIEARNNGANIGF